MKNLRHNNIIRHNNIRIFTSMEGSVIRHLLREQGYIPLHTKCGIHLSVFLYFHSKFCGEEPAAPAAEASGLPQLLPGAQGPNADARVHPRRPVSIQPMSRTAEFAISNNTN